MMFSGRLGIYARIRGLAGATAVLIWSCMPQSLYAADVFSGSEIYLMECSRCHGNQGRGDMAGGIDLSLGDGLRVSDEQLFRRIENGKGGCPSFFGILDEEQIQDVIAHLRTLY
ncbi:c-type cytochrome [Aestuariirhabdus litorea]|uniref:Cytochrome c n=1 Tax=Aestuariirhabdus litorea TaxID=2528527 RepID=A0A3P3VRB0_9GAMM|nr:cytochrome c [Aestuariirhabdus litorea]RRJ85265.1 cytochrome c [Aestuariirhabdus litorea]RWW98487.1 c-type cytochrome [Endozoicomonadaceae bacterium GTF-13]